MLCLASFPEAFYCIYGAIKSWGVGSGIHGAIKSWGVGSGIHGAIKSWGVESDWDTRCDKKLGSGVWERGYLILTSC